MDAYSRLLVAQLGVARALAESSTLAVAASRILRCVCESLDWQGGFLWAPDVGDHHLVEIQAWGDAVWMEEFVEASRRCPMRPGVGLPGRVWKSGRPAWIANVQRDDNFPRVRAAVAAGIRGGFAFPIRAGADVVGVFEFFAKRARPPEARVLAVMESIGRQVGQFFQRRSAEEAIARNAKALRQANARLAERNRQLEAAQNKLRSANRRLAELATTDGLTGVANHRAFQERLATLAAEAGRGRRFALAMLDIDRFKAFNDAHGHPAGDRALAAVAKTLVAGVRRTDFVARYGGEEFAVLFPDADAQTAARLAEFLRKRLRSWKNPWRPLTASFGVAAWRDRFRRPEDIIKAADEAMYRAKRAGRDCVRVAETPAGSALPGASGGISSRRRRRRNRGA